MTHKLHLYIDTIKHILLKQNFFLIKKKILKRILLLKMSVYKKKVPPKYCFINYRRRRIMFKTFNLQKFNLNQITLILVLFIFLMAYDIFGGNIDVYPGESAESQIQNISNNTIIILKPGTYVNIDVYWEWKSNIVLKAETPGTVYFTGNSRIQMRECTSIFIDGIIFHDIFWKHNDGEVSEGIKFIKSYSSKVSNCAFINCGASDNTNGLGIIHIDGGCNNLIVTSCYFKGIKSKAIQVWNRPSIHNHNIMISYNHFKNITKGSNTNGWSGNKAIMLGAGDVVANMNATVRKNLFENCIGDGEIISNKASKNIIEDNTFRNNITNNFNSRLELRTGDGTIVRNNIF